MSLPSTYVVGELRFHATTYAMAPGYGARAWCRACDWSQEFGHYHAPYSGWDGWADVEPACWGHEDRTAERVNRASLSA